MTLREELEAEGWVIASVDRDRGLDFDIDYPIVVRLTRLGCSVFGVGDTEAEALRDARNQTRAVEAVHRARGF